MQVLTSVLRRWLLKHLAFQFKVLGYFYCKVLALYYQLNTVESTHTLVDLHIYDIMRVRDRIIDG